MTTPIHLKHGTLPTTSGLALTAKISGTEAREILDAMRRSLQRFGAYGNNALREMLAAYGYQWQLDPSPTAELADDVDAVRAALSHEHDGEGSCAECVRAEGGR